MILIKFTICLSKMQLYKYHTATEKLLRKGQININGIFLTPLRTGKGNYAENQDLKLKGAGKLNF
jgi:hypothetical protein